MITHKQINVSLIPILHSLCSLEFIVSESNAEFQHSDTIEVLELNNRRVSEKIKQGRTTHFLSKYTCPCMFLPVL